MDVLFWILLFSIFSFLIGASFGTQIYTKHIQAGTPYEYKGKIYVAVEQSISSKPQEVELGISEN